MLLSTSNGSHAHMHTYGQFSMKIRRMLRQTPKMKLIKLGESLVEQQPTPNKSMSTAETLSSLTGSDNEHRICLFSDSPHYIVRVRMYAGMFFLNNFFQVAGTGNIQECEKILTEDVSKLTVFNPAGICAAHNAAARNKIAILALIVRFHGGENIVVRKICCILKYL